ncbi:hypothetical protein WR25_19899 [Diploscapter pachys]|uniref:Uncharacterized protein n=1 Tax=Diploscapter pachys TaxID=2018661 RepID=A0A2A2JX03_9BILA|nr:hypothetical protein WR25_19899 [Diploscapter pachys]
MGLAEEREVAAKNGNIVKRIWKRLRHSVAIILRCKSVRCKRKNNNDDDSCCEESERRSEKVKEKRPKKGCKILSPFSSSNKPTYVEYKFGCFVHKIELSEKDRDWIVSVMVNETAIEELVSGIDGKKAKDTVSLSDSN